MSHVVQAAGSQRNSPFPWCWTSDPGGDWTDFNRRSSKRGPAPSSSIENRLCIVYTAWSMICEWRKVEGTIRFSYPFTDWATLIYWSGTLCTGYSQWMRGSFFYCVLPSEPNLLTPSVPKSSARMRSCHQRTEDFFWIQRPAWHRTYFSTGNLECYKTQNTKNIICCSLPIFKR